MLPEASLQINLANTKGIYSRRAPSIFTFLAEVGGFIVMIVLLPTLIMGMYTER